MKYKALKVILYILITLNMAMLVVYFFLYNDIKQKNQHVSILLHDLSSESRQKDFLTSTQKSIQNINSDIVRIDNSIVPKEGDVKFIEGLETVAKENNLKISINTLLFEDNPKLSSTSVTTLRVSAGTQGSWAGTYAFIDQLESLPYKVKIGKFAIESVGSDAGPDTKKSTKVVNSWQSTFELNVLEYK